MDRGNAPVFGVGRKEYTRIVRTAFSMRRKTLFNNLKTIMDADSVTDILSSLGIPPAARAQEISPEQYAGIAHLAKDMK
jgi:16S rRNA (adenine1518-N6/adenine1519-N6)-dimethyltransferase